MHLRGYARGGKGARCRSGAMGVDGGGKVGKAGRDLATYGEVVPAVKDEAFPR